MIIIERAEEKKSENLDELNEFPSKLKVIQTYTEYLGTAIS